MLIYLKKFRIIGLTLLFQIVCSNFYLNGQNTVGLITYESEAFEAYTLFSPNNKQTYLIDNCGLIINQWTSQYSTTTSAYLLEDGSLLRSARAPVIPFTSGGEAGILERISWDGDILWQSEYVSNTFLFHHDFEVLPNGNILLIVWDLISPEHLRSLGKIHVNPGGLFSEKIVEIAPVGSNNFVEIWEWNAIDHTVQDVDSLLDNYGIIEDHPELLDINYRGSTERDWLHFNSIDYNEDLDQILLSSRAYNEIYIIDHSVEGGETSSNEGGLAQKGGNLIYRWGNPQTYKIGEESAQQLFGQHHAEWIPSNLEGSGNITLYNNGINRPEGNYSSVIEIIPSRDGTYNYNLLSDDTFGPAEPFWNYEAEDKLSFYSDRFSSAQRLSNGNTLINEGIKGHFFEVNKDKELVWEYINPSSINDIIISQGEDSGKNYAFRAQKYAYDFAGFRGKDLSPQQPIELNPIPENCQTTSTKNVKLASVRLAETIVHTDYIDVNKLQANELSYAIYNLNGQKIRTEISVNKHIDISTLFPGLYILYLTDGTKRQVDRFVKN